MERKSPGVVNAYLLNLMTHANTLRMDEYDLRDRIREVILSVPDRDHILIEVVRE